MPKGLASVLTAALLLLSGCDDGGSASVYDISTGDPSMNAAIAEARRTAPEFVDRLPELQGTGATVSVKIPVSEDGKVEHIWLANLRYENGQIKGTLANEPVDLPSWSYGDAVSVPLDQISDWMAIQHGELFGGYTLFAIRDGLAGPERRRFEASVGMAFPDEPRSLE